MWAYGAVLGLLYALSMVTRWASNGLGTARVLPLLAPSSMLLCGLVQRRQCSAVAGHPAAALV